MYATSWTCKVLIKHYNFFKIILFFFLKTNFTDGNRTRKPEEEKNTLIYFKHENWNTHINTATKLFTRHARATNDHVDDGEHGALPLTGTHFCCLPSRMFTVPAIRARLTEKNSRGHIMYDKNEHKKCKNV